MLTEPKKTYMNVVGKPRFAWHFVAMKALLLTPIQTVSVISYRGLWHSKLNIPRDHSLSCCVFVPDISPIGSFSILFLNVTFLISPVLLSNSNKNEKIDRILTAGRWIKLHFARQSVIIRQLLKHRDKWPQTAASLRISPASWPLVHTCSEIRVLESVNLSLYFSAVLTALDTVSGTE